MRDGLRGAPAYLLPTDQHPPFDLSPSSEDPWWLRGGPSLRGCTIRGWRGYVGFTPLTRVASRCADDATAPNTLDPIGCICIQRDRNSTIIRGRRPHRSCRHSIQTRFRCQQKIVHEIRNMWRRGETTELKGKTSDLEKCRQPSRYFRETAGLGHQSMRNQFARQKREKR